MRRWERTSEPFFVEEENERRLESLFEADLEQQQQRAQREAGGLILGPEGGSFGGAAAAAAGGDVDADAAAAAGRRTIESVSAADAIIDALDVAANEAKKNEEFERELRAAQVGRRQEFFTVILLPGAGGSDCRMMASAAAACKTGKEVIN
jgi:U3 small nucleolar RNA-associated protein 12